MALTIFGEHDQKVIDQLQRCVDAEEGAVGVLCADGHYGYSMPVGGVVAYREHLSPAGVGFDIGCGNKAVRTPLLAEDIHSDIPGIMDEVFRRISFGMGVPAQEKVDHPVLEDIRNSPVSWQRNMIQLAENQLGTVGGGNHYVDLFEDGVGYVWVGVHFGSRGFGHKTASHYTGDGPMDAAPELLPITSEKGNEYIEAMTTAGAYAYAGRDVVVDKVLEILGTQSTMEIHNHHNYAWREEHGSEWWWVVRKGATPAFPGQRGFVGGSMEDDAVILEGVDTDQSLVALRSTVHGAGRAMSRTQAAGKSRRRWGCNNRDCEWVQPPRSHKPDACPDCGGVRFSKRWIREVEGAVDWSAVTARLREGGIELRGANAEEAPEAYKRLPEVLYHHRNSVRVLYVLSPLGVAMAPGDVRDPYKD